MTEQALEILRQGLDRLGLTYPPDAVERLALYGDRLLEKNQVMNLTAITDPCEVARLHFLDSASLLPSKTLHGRKVIDVGTGGGFPGLVLKILDPSIQLTLLDSLGKRIDWLQEVCEELGLYDVVCLKGRAEETARQKTHREQYDVAVSRALASMPMLAELCIPYVKPGGLFLAMKSIKTDEEIEAAHPNPGGRQALCHGLSGAGDRHLAPYRHRGKAPAHPQGLPQKVDEDQRIKNLVCLHKKVLHTSWLYGTMEQKFQEEWLWAASSSSHPEKAARERPLSREGSGPLWPCKGVRCFASTPTWACGTWTLPSA